MSKKNEKKNEETMHIENVANIVTHKDPKDKWEEKRLRYNKPIRGIFRNLEAPGGTTPLTYLQFKGDPMRRWTLEDGKTYTLPLGAVLQLKKSSHYHGDVWIKSLDGKPAKKSGTKITRFVFEPFDFISDEEYQEAELMPDIIKVRHA